MGKYTQAFVKRILATDSARFYRPPYNSYGSSTEWRNVEEARELARYLKGNNSFFHFPYLRQIWTMWGVTWNTYFTARRRNTAREILTSEYGVMDAFVTFFSTVESVSRKIISIGLAPLLARQNKTETQQAIAECVDTYAQGLETIPFYSHPYLEYLKRLRAAYQQAGNRTWTDWLSMKIFSLELLTRHWISKPLHAFFNSEENIVTPTTDVIVKFRSDKASGDEAKAEFLARLNTLPQGEADVVNNNVYSRLSKDKKTGLERQYVYARLSVSRYKAFQATLQHLDEQKIGLRNIAGNEYVQIKCLVDAENAEELSSKISTMQQGSGGKYLYRYQNNIDPKRHFCFFDVPVKDLAEKVRCLEESGEVSYIHNF